MKSISVSVHAKAVRTTELAGIGGPTVGLYVLYKPIYRPMVPRK